jgi:nucleotide-binding universal stress UspA family protein
VNAWEENMKILVAYDGSITSEKVLAVAVLHAKAFNASVDLLTSMESGDEKQMAQIKETERQLDYAKEKCESNGVPCEKHLLIRGLEPGDDILKFALENNVDEIIIGIRHRSRVGKIVFGSTAQYIIFNASCPVVTVKGDVKSH